MSDVAMQHQECGNCYYFEKFDADSGICRRYPPKQLWIDFNDDTDPGEAELMSNVFVFDWCGEWKTDKGCLDPAE
jgi:hypothetical protein